MNKEFVELLGIKAEVRTPPKPNDELSKSGKIKKKAPEYFLECDKYTGPYFPRLQWDSTYEAFIIEDLIYISDKFSFHGYDKNLINSNYIETSPKYFQNLNDELLRNILIKMVEKIEKLENRLDNI